jgi:transcriptional regulator with XRE-family HTH domain
MTGAELNAAREFLGLTIERLADFLAVDPATVRKWEQGKYAVPAGVRAEVQGLEELTDQAVEDLIATLEGMPAPVVLVWRGADAEEDLGLNLPRFAAYGARWWRHVAYRAAREVPGTRIGTNEELAELRAEGIGVNILPAVVPSDSDGV